jgi:hypothetical protein
MPKPGLETPATGVACGGHVPACVRGLLSLPRFAIAPLVARLFPSQC